MLRCIVDVWMKNYSLALHKHRMIAVTVDALHMCEDEFQEFGEICLYVIYAYNFLR